MTYPQYDKDAYGWAGTSHLENKLSGYYYL